VRIDEIIKSKGPTFSVEFFPPKTEEATAALFETARALRELDPDFVSVTYGAGGSTRERTHSTVRRLVAETALTPAAHLTCVAATRAEIDAVILSGVDLPRLVAIVLERMAQLAPADRHFLLLPNDEAPSGYLLHLATGVVALELPAEEIKRLLAAPGGAEGLYGVTAARVFALPIVLHAHLAGAIVLAYDDAARQPAPEEIPLLRDLADRVAVALATASRRFGPARPVCARGIFNTRCP